MEGQCNLRIPFLNSTTSSAARRSQKGFAESPANRESLRRAGGSGPGKLQNEPRSQGSELPIERIEMLGAEGAGFGACFLLLALRVGLEIELR